MGDVHAFELAIRLTEKFFAMRREIMDGLGWRAVIDMAVAALGIAVMLICLCRMNQLERKHMLSHKLSYVVLFTASFCLSFAPWLFGARFVRLGSVIFVAAVILHLVVIGLSWRRGPPRDMETYPAPLEP